MGVSAAVLTAVTTILPKVEGTKYTVYKDSAGIPTVCTGITGPDVIPGKTYTQEECDALLLKHTKVASDYVHKVVTRPIPSSMEAALISFTYNVGTGAFGRSSVLREINAGNYEKGCKHLYDWVYITVNGEKVKLKGLQNRRDIEYSYCIKDIKQAGKK